MPAIAALMCALLAVSLGLCAPNAAHAATCRVSATAVRFGNYNPLSTVPVNRAGRLIINCSGKGTLVAALNTGASGSYTPRYLLSASGDQLDYNLYIDAARSIIWGDGSGSTQTVSRSFNNNRVRLTVYAQLPAMQNVVAGKYLDHIIATVTF